MKKLSPHCLLAFVLASAPSTLAFLGQSVRLAEHGKTSSLNAATTAEGIPPPRVTSSVSSSMGPTAEFPPPLTQFEKFQRAATFWSTAIPIVANYYGLIGNLRLQELLGSPLNDEDVQVSPLVTSLRVTMLDFFSLTRFLSSISFLS